MKRRYRKLMAMFAAAFMLFSVTFASVPASAQTSIKYAALGDSVTVGLSSYKSLNPVDYYGYADMLDDYLEIALDVDYRNLGEEGLDSVELLGLLTSNAGFREKVAGSRIVTINIGSNNLLTPVLPTVAAAFGATDLRSLYDNIRKLSYTAAMARYAALDDSPSPLVQLFPAGVDAFKATFPGIIASVMTLAPEAKIIVNNLYNPLPAGDALYSFVDKHIRKINAIITENAPGSYVIANSYAAFKAYETSRLAVTFSGRNAILAAKLGSYQAFLMAVDPHPTTFGHTLIFGREKNLLR